MTDKEQNEIPQNSQSVGTQTAPLPEVPDLLAKISRRITESQSAETSENQAGLGGEALDAMRGRLDSLKHQASTARSELRGTGDELATFSSVEAALSKLSEGVDDAESAAAAGVEGSNSEAETESHSTSTPVDDSEMQSKAPVERKSSFSRLAGSTSEPVSDALAEAQSVPVPSTDAVQDRAWNEESAEQLTKQCEDAGLAKGPAADNLLIGADAAPAASEPVSYVYLQPDSREIGQQWFEQRFEDLAKRFDAVTSETGQGGSATIASLESKFDALETRLDALLGYSSDDGEAAVGGSLNDIELCIAEIANQLEATTAELARIEGIEGKLGELSEVLAGQGKTAGHDSGSALDVAVIADLVADRVASKPIAFASSGAAMEPGDAAGMSELSSAMKEFMRERRNEGEHANAVLDTMQQTIIRVLDRMEALESKGPHENASSGPGIATSTAMPARPAPAKPARPQQSKAAQPAATQQADRSPPVAAAPAAPKSPVEKVRSPVTETAAEAGDATVSLNRLQLAVGKLDNAEPARRQPAGDIEAAQVAPRSRTDFIAAARKAASSAGGQSNADNMANDDEIDLVEIDATEDGFSLGSAGARKQSTKPNSRVRLLVAAIALVAVGLGATKFMMSRSGEAALQQLQSNRTQQGTNQSDDKKITTRAAARRVGDVVPVQPLPSGLVQKSSADPVMENVRPGDVVYRSGDGSLIQQAALSPQQTKLSEDGQPVSGGASSVARKNLPSALVGPLSLRLAAANGDASAEFQVAARFAEGKGVRQDFDAAHKWYRRAAGRGFALAQYRLGTLYERGLGVEKDPARARAWYQRAAQQDNIKAMHNLAVLAASSATGKPDYDTAARWFTEAAERGLGDSQFNLAILHQNGLGVPMEETVAYKWFSLAASSGDGEALKRQLELAKKLGKNKVRKIDREVRGWLRKPSNKMANDPHYAGQAWQRS